MANGISAVGQHDAASAADTTAATAVAGAPGPASLCRRAAWRRQSPAEVRGTLLRHVGFRSL
jgi:hypothetical protein